MTVNLSAYQNQRFQWTRDVTAFATTYGAALNTATWRMQVRPFAGSPVVTLDFMTGGSPQNSALTAAYDSGAKTVRFRAPTSLVSVIPAGTYYFDFGFIIIGADFERVDGGSITFAPGVTLAGVVGAPAAPTAADDTVTVTT